MVTDSALKLEYASVIFVDAGELKSTKLNLILLPQLLPGLRWFISQQDYGSAVGPHTTLVYSILFHQIEWRHV